MDADPHNLSQPLEKGYKKKFLMGDQWICIIFGLQLKVKDGAFWGGASLKLWLIGVSRNQQFRFFGRDTANMLYLP